MWKHACENLFWSCFPLKKKKLLDTKLFFLLKKKIYIFFTNIQKIHLVSLTKKKLFLSWKKKGLWRQNPFFNGSRDINKGGKTTETRPNWVSARLQAQHLIWMTIQYKWNKYALILLNVLWFLVFLCQGLSLLTLSPFQWVCQWWCPLWRSVNPCESQDT